MAGKLVDNCEVYNSRSHFSIEITDSSQLFTVVHHFASTKITIISLLFVNTVNFCFFSIAQFSVVFFFSLFFAGVWQVPMVMWQDLNGGRCSMGDACSNPPDADGVVKMLMKNFDRHYTTNRYIISSHHLHRIFEYIFFNYFFISFHIEHHLVYFTMPLGLPNPITKKVSFVS